MSRFDWDRENIRHIGHRRHHVTKQEAETAFTDPHAIDAVAYDTETEERFALIGMAATRRVLFVFYTVHEDLIRIVTVRRATDDEEHEYWSRR